MSNFNVTVEETFRKVYQGTIYTVNWNDNGVDRSRKFTSQKAAFKFAARGFPKDFNGRGWKQQRLNREYAIANP